MTVRMTRAGRASPVHDEPGGATARRGEGAHERALRSGTGRRRAGDGCAGRPARTRRRRGVTRPGHREPVDLGSTADRGERGRPAHRRGAAELARRRAADRGRAGDGPTGETRRRWPLGRRRARRVRPRNGVGGLPARREHAGAVDAERRPAPSGNGFFGNGGAGGCSGNGFNVPGFGSFPGFGNGRGASTVEHRADRRQPRPRSALVDVNTTIDDGPGVRGGDGHRAERQRPRAHEQPRRRRRRRTLSVTDLGNGQTYEANVLGYDVTRDVAVIQLVGASGLTWPRSAARRTSVRPCTRSATRAARAAPRR